MFKLNEKSQSFSLHSRILPWCTNPTALNKTSEALETGMVAVNTPFLSSAETPFGGIKQSGYGREGGSVGIKDYLNIKYTHLATTG